MSTLSEKLLVTLATKQNIKREIEKKGVTVGDIPFSEYPSKIASIGITSEEWREPDWIDILTVRLLDTEDYLFKSIYLLDDSTDVVDLLGGEAYKTSDSDTLITESGVYTFTGTGDVECSKGYKTRWVMVYKNLNNDTQPQLMNNSLLYTVLDGVLAVGGFSNHVKLRYVDCLSDVSVIRLLAFWNCNNLLYVSGLKNVQTIHALAFKGCISLLGIDSEGGYTLCDNVFDSCTNIKQLILRNVAISGSNQFINSSIKELIWGSTSTITFYGLQKIILEEGSTFPINVHTASYDGKIVVENAPKIIKSLTPRASALFLLEEVEDNYNSSGSGGDMYNNVPSLKKLKLNGDFNNVSNVYAGNNCLNLKELHLPNIKSAWIKNNELLEILNAPNLQNGIVNKVSLESLSLPSFLETNSESFNYLRKCKSIELPLFHKSQYSIMCNNPEIEHIELPSLNSLTISGSATIYSFKNLDKCKTISLPSLKTVNHVICTDLPSLESIDFPELETINSVSMYNLGSCTSIRLPKLTGTFNGAFNCPNLLELDLPLVTSLHGIYDNEKLITINAPNASSIYYIYNCPSLKNLNLDNVKSLPYYNSLNYLGIETLNLPSVTTIKGTSGSTAYYICCNLPNLQEVNLPMLTSVEQSNSSYIMRFDNCPSLKVFNAPNLTVLWSYFLNKTGIEEYTISKKVTKLESCVLHSAPKLRRLIFEDGYNGVYSTSTNLFYYTAASCPNLEYVYLPASITRISNNSYTYYLIGHDCPKLTTIELGQGYKRTLNLRHIKTLTKECVVNMLNALADLTGGTALTLYIYSETLALLSDEEKAIATNKNWTLAS